MLAHHDHPGPGPALVLLHAFPLDSSMWRRLVPLLAGRARVVTVDLPGLGASAVPRPAPGAEPSMRLVADLVVEALDHLGVERCVPFGVSTGGYVALELVARRPDRVAGLVLGSTTPRLVAPDVPDQRRRTASEVEAAGSTAPVAGSAQEGLGETARREQPALERELTDLIATADPGGVAWMARAIAARTDRVTTLAAYDGPVRLLFGAEDRATPPTRGEQMLADRAGSGAPTTLDVLPATGHLTALERPEAVAALLSPSPSPRRSP